MAPFLHYSGIDEKVFLPVPSLEHIAVLKIAITLWNLPLIRRLIDKLRSMKGFQRCADRSGSFAIYQYLQAKNSRRKSWELIETKVRDYAKELRLPEILKNKVEKIIKNVGREILKWKKFHQLRFGKPQDSDVLLPTQLFWTAFGTIDRKKTTQALVKDASVCVDLRYKFACCYCLENDIAELWKELPADYKIDFKSNHVDWENLWLKVVNCRINERWLLHDSTKSSNLEHFWGYVMGGGGDLEGILASKYYPHISKFLMQQICVESNIYALQYYFPKLNQEMRGLFFDRIAKEFSTTVSCPYYKEELFFFLLSLLDESQQKEFLTSENCASKVIFCLFRWPWDAWFMPLAHCLYPFLNPHDFVYILCHAVHQRYNQELIAEFFECSPEYFKQCIVDKCSNYLLFFLFRRDNKRLIQMIWKHAAVEKKRADIINACEKVANIFYYEQPRDIKKNECWENLFFLLVELSREERKRNYQVKKRKREETKEERNAKMFRKIQM